MARLWKYSLTALLTINCVFTAYLLVKVVGPTILPLAYGSWSYLQGDYDAAELWSDQSLLARPSFFAHFLKASANLKRENFRAAEKDYSNVIELKPDLVEAYQGRALTRLNLDNVQGVIDDFSKVIELKPGDSDAHFMRGYLRSRQGDNQEAYRDLYRAAALYKAENKSDLAKRAHRMADDLMQVYARGLEKGLSSSKANGLKSG